MAIRAGLLLIAAGALLGCRGAPPAPGMPSGSGPPAVNGLERLTVLVRGLA